jgi:hypothetical protein
MNRDQERLLGAYLDGRLARYELPEELRADEERLAELLDDVRCTDLAPPGLRGDVMARIDALPESRLRHLRDWLLRPRTVRVSPAAAGSVGLLAAAGVAALLLIADGPASRDVLDPPGAASDVLPVLETAGSERGANAVVTRFVLVAPEAESVILTGDWVDWATDQLPLRQLRGSGVWTVDVPVPPGVHEYSFIVDGTEWRSDPLADTWTDDGFGRTNSVLMVSGAEV